MTKMTDQELIDTLRHMAPETGTLRCFGCGYEHGCSIHGCVILRKTAERLTELTALPPNPQLTLEQLREMDGEPVWNDTIKKWMLVDLLWEFRERTVDHNGKWRGLDDRYYRHKPEKGQA